MDQLDALGADQVVTGPAEMLLPAGTDLHEAPVADHADELARELEEGCCVHIHPYIGNSARSPQRGLRHNAAASNRKGTMEAVAQTNGQATEAAVLESFSPATGERSGAVRKLERGDVQSVVDDVGEVQPFWAQLPLSDRARYMRRAAQVVIDNLDELTELLSREQGKPRSEAYTMELLPTIDGLRWIAEAGPHILADERVGLPLFLKQKRAKHAFE